MILILAKGLQKPICHNALLTHSWGYGTRRALGTLAPSLPLARTILTHPTPEPAA